MTTGSDDLPRWKGITEPMTALTNVLLSVLAFALAGVLGYPAAAEGAAAGVSIAAALLATSLAAAFGAGAHATDPSVAPRFRAALWRGALYFMGPAGAASIASVAFFAARGGARMAILVFALVKLIVYFVVVTRRPEFRVAAIDYGVALAVLLAGAGYAAVRWSEPGSSWLIGGVLVSLVAGLVQAKRLGAHRHFNHNDVYHLIQMVALYLFYRGGALLVDR